MPGFRLLGPQGQVYPIQGETVFGRDPQATFAIQDNQMSRRHARVFEAGGRLWIQDEGSANGTFVNGRRLTAAIPLSPGDQIRFGTTVLSVPGGAPPSAATPAAAPQPAPAAPSSKPRSRLPLVLGGCAVLGLCAVVAGAGAYFLPRTGMLAGVPSLGGAASSSDYTLQDALADETVDDRPEVLAYLGKPDAFTISQIVVDGAPVRVETWRYYGFGTRVDFVDGEAALTVDIEPAPDDTIFPAWYDPLSFDLGMSPSEVALEAAAESPAGTTPEAIDLSQGGDDLAGGTLLVGDQIVIGLDATGVVYVETMALFPAEEGG